MMRIGLGAMLVTFIAAGSAMAQDTQSGQRNPQVARAISAFTAGRYRSPNCKADDTDHFKVSSGRTYLKTAIENPNSRERALNDAVRVITEAIRENDQGQSPSAWYFLGTAYLHQGDVAGADSALAKAVELAPDCTEEVDTLRQVAFVPLFNSGIDSAKTGNTQAAQALFRQAADINPKAPEPAYELGRMHFNAGRLDSAAVYFGRAVEGAQQDPDKKEFLGQAQFNYGYALLQLNRPQEAIPVLQAYRAAQPDDADALRLLVNAYRAAGQPDSAAALEQELIASAAAGGTEVAGGDLFQIGVQRFQAQQYEGAAEAFTQVLEREPYNRDALFNLANTYVALQDWQNLTATAERLAALDPMNETVLKLLGEGYRQTQQTDSAVAVAERVLGLPLAVEVSAMQVSESGARLNGTATGRKATTPSGAAIDPAPAVLVFEFLDQSGNPVATQEVNIPALAAGEAHQFTAEGTGSGIVAWRYSRSGEAGATQ